MTTIIKGSTARGKQLKEKAMNNAGYYLHDVYSKVSYAKEQAYKYCFEKFANTKDSYQFHICSFNTFQFSVAWYGIFTMLDGTEEYAIFMETANNSYVILLNK